MFTRDADKHIYEDKALYLLGNIYESELSDFPKAIETFEKLLANYPNSLYLDEAREKIIDLQNKTS